MAIVDRGRVLSEADKVAAPDATDKLRVLSGFEVVAG